MTEIEKRWFYWEVLINGPTSENLNASKPLVFKPFSIQTRRFWIEQRLRETAIIIMIRTMRLSFHVNFNFFLLQVFEKISHSYFSANISGHYENSFEIWRQMPQKCVNNLIFSGFKPFKLTYLLTTTILLQHYLVLWNPSLQYCLCSVEQLCGSQIKHKWGWGKTIIHRI